MPNYKSRGGKWGPVNIPAPAEKVEPEVKAEAPAPEFVPDPVPEPEVKEEPKTE